MRSLLADAPERIRDCLGGQVGRVAGRNSCRAGWSSSLDLHARVQPWRRALDRRLQISVTTSNAISLADRMVNGRGAMRGWAGSASVDPTLLRIRGFDADAGEFRYEVNPAFGTTSASRARLARPFTVTVEARVTVGADPAYQPLQRLLNRTSGAGRSRDEIRYELSRHLPNLPAQAVAADSAARLHLTAAQRTALAGEAERAGLGLAPAADSIAAILSDVENGRARSRRAAWRKINALTRAIQGEMDEQLRRIREILSAEQWSLLPEAIRVPSRQLIPARSSPGEVEIQ